MTAILNRSITIRPLNLPRLFSPLHPSILVGILLSMVFCQPLHAGITDCNNNGIEDATDIANGTSTDCNADGVPDDCASGVAFRPYSMSTNSIFRYTSATPADLDGDGDLDLAARYFNFFPNTLTVFENYDGEGPSLRGTIFPEFGTTSSFPGTRDMASADIDGDGDHDLVIDFGSSGGIRWLENIDGLGGDWQAHDVSAQTTNIVELALLDFDQDGDIDVIAGGEYLDAILLFKNDGAGNFSPPITAIDSIPLVDFVLADIDTDGQLDIVLTQTGPEILGWVRFDPNSDSFEPFVPIATPYIPFSEIVVEAGDVDGDNDNDIVIARRRNVSFTVLENTTGTGQFSVRQEFTSIQARANDLKLADLDQDDDLDLIIGSTFTTSPVDPIRWHLNDSGVISTVSESVRYADAPVIRMKLADMNGDGREDVLATTNSSESAVIFFATDRDCDDNGINDACEIADGLAADCDANGIPDICDSVLADCNNNQTPDWCEVDTNNDGLINACEPQPGDVNCDGVVDIADVPAFALALVNRAIYAVQFPDCTLDAADVNADQLLNAKDIEEMLTLLTSP